jgi:outer membrane protein OmpA-like peptidoglycan-associated protein
MAHGNRTAWAFAAMLGVQAGSALAQGTARTAMADLPSWKIPEICAKDSAKDHCVTLESRAWRTVSGSWVSLPDTVKKLCLGSARTPADYSWRVLNDCVDEEMEKAADKRAVATIRTPAEPVPAAKVVAAPVAVPPPVLGFQAAPPPFALDAEADAKRRAEADAKAKAEADAKTAADTAAAARARADAEAKAKADADAKTAADTAAAARARADAEAKAKADTDARAAAAAEVARKAAAEAEAKRLADEVARKAAADAGAKRMADAAADAKARDEAEAKRRAAALAAAKVCQDDLQKIAKDGVIRFTFGSAALDRASSATLEKLAASVRACPGHVVSVEAHTDSIGDPDFNLNLSQRRAQTVVDALVKLELPIDLIKAEGFGETKPIADNVTGAGRAQNRRIEFIVLPK